MAIKNVLLDTEDKMKKTVDSVRREFAELRTGRASTSLVEGILVEYYGTRTPIKQLGTISVTDARMVVIHPWDPSIISAIEKAILQSALGITPNNDGKVIRISLPHLTDERRAELDKIVKRIAEGGRISLRTARRDANELLKQMEKEKNVTEDQRFTAQEQVQKMIDKYIKEVNSVLESKEKEIQEG